MTENNHNRDLMAHKAENIGYLTTYRKCFQPLICNTGLGSEFITMTEIQVAIRENIDKFHYMKMKSLHGKKQHNLNQRTITNCSKIFVTCLADKGLLSLIQN